MFLGLLAILIRRRPRSKKLFCPDKSASLGATLGPAELERASLHCEIKTRYTFGL